MVLQWDRSLGDCSLLSRTFWIFSPPIIVVASASPAGCSRATGGRAPGLMSHGGAHARKRFSASPDTRIIVLRRVSVT